MRRLSDLERVDAKLAQACRDLSLAERGLSRLWWLDVWELIDRLLDERLALTGGQS